MTRTVRDAAIMLRTMASVDPKDSTSVDVPVPDYEALLEGGIKGLRVGIPKEYRIDGTPAGDRCAVGQGRGLAEGAGRRDRRGLPAPHQIRAADLLHRRARPRPRPTSPAMTACASAIAPSGAHDITDLYEKSRAEGFGAEVQRRILIGTYVLSAGYYDAYYSRAQKLRTLIMRDFDQAFEKCDVLLTPDDARSGLRAWAPRPPIRWRCI